MSTDTLSKRKLYEIEKIENFKELVNRYKNLYKNKIAFKFKLSPQSKEIQKVSYNEFADDIVSLSDSLLKMDFKHKRIAIIAPNRYEWCVSYLAITTADIVVVPLDKSLPDNEIKNLIKRSEATAVLFDKKYLHVFNEIYSSQDSNLKDFICYDNISKEDAKKLDNNFTSNLLNYKTLVQNGKSSIENGSTLYDNIKIDNKKMSIMLFTSGTTSTSKAVMLSQQNICEDIYAIGQIAKVTTDDTFLSFLPLHHTFESSCTFLYGTFCGITVAFCDGIKYIANNLKEFSVTGFVCVPLMLEMMYKKVQKGVAEQGKTKLVNFMRKVCNILLKFKIDIRKKVFKDILNNLGGNLKTLIAGGASMSKDAIKYFLDLGINLLQGYGLTETSPVIIAENDKYKRAGSVGFPLPGVEIKIDNPNSNGIGEIVAKSPTVMLGYYNDPKATEEVIKDGWFYTGDLGYIDKDGYVFITGRKKDVIVLKNGKNIYPEEIESLINNLDYVQESMVFEKPDKGDFKIYAKIVYNKEIIKEQNPDISENDYYDLIWNDIKSKVNKQMPTYKYIRGIIITDTPLIKTTTQKIKRFEELKKLNFEKQK